MFLTVLGAMPHDMKPVIKFGADTGDDLDLANTDDTAGPAIWSLDDTCGPAIWSLGETEKRDPPAKEPVYDRAEHDGGTPDGEPLFVDGAMRALGIGGGMLAPNEIPAIISLIRHRDPRPVVAPYVC